MLMRLLAVLVVVAALIAAIVYSQHREVRPFVSGILETDEIRLGSRVGGRISRVLVEEGDQVSAGSPLVELEPFDLLDREQQAAAELAAREAELKRLQAGLRAEEIAQAGARMEQLAAQVRLLEAGPRPQEIEAARQRLVAATAERDLYQSEFERMSRLIQTNAVSRSDLDVTRQRLDAAKSNMEVRKSELAILEAGTRTEELEGARARLDEARLAWELAQKGYRAEEIEQAEAARNAARAALEVVRQQKAELTIAAPVDGVIDALDVRAGDLAAPNAPVLTLLSEQRMWVRAWVPQRFLQLATGDTVKVTFDSLPGEEFRGEVTFVSSQAEFVPGNVQTSDDRAKLVYRVRVMIEEGRERLRPGMTALVWLESGT